MINSFSEFDLEYLNTTGYDPDKAPLEADALADGEYTFIIRATDYKNYPAKKTFVVEIHAEAISGPSGQTGKLVAHRWTLKDKESMTRALRELAKFGFDVNNWGKDGKRPIAGELVKTQHVFVGMRFSATKETNGKYHNLRIQSRLPDGKPTIIGPEQLNAAPPIDPADADPFGG